MKAAKSCNALHDPSAGAAAAAAFPSLHEQLAAKDAQIARLEAENEALCERVAIMEAEV